MRSSFYLPLVLLVTSIHAHEKHPSANEYSPPTEAVEIGAGEFRYRLVSGWAMQNADNYKLGNCNAIAQDGRGRILLLHTSKEHCLIALNADGKVLDAWGDFTVAAHGLSVVKEEDREVLFISDHSAGGNVYKTTLDGEILMTIACPMESGLYKNAQEFKPAKTLHLPGGEFFVIDGYGKDYIHRYSADGRWLSAFGGEIGEGEAQLKHWGPHGGALDFTGPDKPTMILALSDQQKMKRFKLDGTWLETKSFPGSNPRDVLFHRDHLFVHHLGDNWPKDRDAPGYISVLDRDWKVVANLGGSKPGYDQDGNLAAMKHTTHLFHHPHGMAIDRDGNIYVAQAASNGTWPLKFVPIDTLTTWNVSADGDDSNPGTPEKPFRTISRGSDVARPGDTVLVHPGVYRERVAPGRAGENGKPITYRAEKLGTVFIRGSDEWAPVWKAEGRGVFSAVPDQKLFTSDDAYRDSANPFRVELSSTPYNRQGKPELERFGKGDANVVYNCGQVIVNGRPWEQRPILTEIKTRPQTWNFDPGSGKIAINFGKLDPAAAKVEITTRRRIFAPHAIGQGYITIEGFVMEHCGNQYCTNFWNTPEWAQAGALGLRGGHHWIVRNNLIRYANSDAISIGTGGGRNNPAPKVIGGPLGEDNLIENNYLLENGAGGIIGAQHTRTIIRGNVIMYNNALGFIGKKRYEHAGIKSHGIRDALIEHNYIAHNPRSEGIWLDNQFPGTRVTRNVVVNNGARGIFLEMSDYKFDAALIDHNISIGNDIQFYVHDASGSTVMHNLFANSPADAKYGQGAYIYQVTTRTKTGYHSLYNNLFIKHKVMLDINYPAHRSGPQRLDHNVYEAAPGERAFLINRASDVPSPWEKEEFFALVKSDVGGGAPQALDGGAKVALTLGEWRMFWKRHGQDNDLGSVVHEGMRVEFDEGSLVLTVEIQFEPGEVGSTDNGKLAQDYFGKPLPLDGKSKPGPFQSLKKGVNTFKVWDGLPLLERGALPQRD